MKELLKDKNYKNGAYFFNKGNFEKAISEFNSSLKTYPDNSLIYANLGLCYANLEQFDKAIIYFDKSLEVDINQSQVWDAKVTLLEKLGRTEDLALTMKKFDETVKKSPELLGIKPLHKFDPPLPDGLKLYSLGNVGIKLNKTVMQHANYFLSILQIPRQNVRFFYFRNELLIAIEEISGAWMKSSFKNLELLNFFDLYKKDG